MNQQVNAKNPQPVGTGQRGHFRAYDGYYHATPKGTGSALKIELHPAHDETAGSIFIRMALQRTVASMQDGNKVFPTFDWANGVSVKLDRTDISHVLQVLRGMQESILDDKGLFHRSSAGNTVIKFSHQIEPRPGYLLSVWRKPPVGEAVSVYYVFDMNEAFALMLSLERALMYVCFGIPEVIARRPALEAPSSPATPSRPVSMAPVRTPAMVPTVEDDLDDDLVDYPLAAGDPF